MTIERRWKFPSSCDAMQIIGNKHTVLCLERRVLGKEPAYFHHQTRPSKLPETGNAAGDDSMQPGSKDPRPSVPYALKPCVHQPKRDDDPCISIGHSIT